jgi:hypothetical protein
MLLIKVFPKIPKAHPNSLYFGLNGRPLSVTTSWTDFSVQNLVFWQFIWIFSDKNRLKIQYLLHPKSKTYKISSIKSHSSRSFQQYQRHIPILILELNGKPSSVTTFSTDFSFQNLVFFVVYLNLQQQKSLKIQYLRHPVSKSYKRNSIKSCSSRSFQQHQTHIPILLKCSFMI